MSSIRSSRRSGFVADIVVILGAVVFGLGAAGVGVGVIAKPFQIGTTMAGVIGLLVGLALVNYGVSLDQDHANRGR